MSAVTKDMIGTIVAMGGSSRRDHPSEARFRPGDIVRTIATPPVTHTRLPAYARGRTGTIIVDQGIFVTPETSAHGYGDSAQHVYNVAFRARELWGEDASAHDSVRLDLWDEHLEIVTW